MHRQAMQVRILYSAVLQPDQLRRHLGRGRPRDGKPKCGKPQDGQAAEWDKRVRVCTVGNGNWKSR